MYGMYCVHTCVYMQMRGLPWEPGRDLFSHALPHLNHGVGVEVWVGVGVGQSVMFGSILTVEPPHLMSFIFRYKKGWLIPIDENLRTVNQFINLSLDHSKLTHLLG
jgi:hypothetical protein